MVTNAKPAHGLFMLALCVTLVLGVMFYAWTTRLGLLSTHAAGVAYQSGPVTGNEFANYFANDADHYRSVLKNYDKVIALAREVGDQPFFPVLQKFVEQSDAAQAAVQTPAQN
ncbi:MAG: hypothetical protein GC162_00180 [Planctomycetes bacterium]|nr:hypothetical protein [Planctomycetota bacterium]